MKWIVICGFILFSCPFNTHATSLQIAFLGYSNHHVDRNYDYNENHKLIGFSINNGFSAAHFVNSYNNNSTLIGWNFSMDDSLNIQKLSFRLGAMIGLVTGYEQDQIITYINDDISLYLIPQLTLSYPITDTIALSR